MTTPQQGPDGRYVLTLQDVADRLDSDRKTAEIVLVQLEELARVTFWGDIKDSFEVLDNVDEANGETLLYLSPAFYEVYLRATQNHPNTRPEGPVLPS